MIDNIDHNNSFGEKGAPMAPSSIDRQQQSRVLAAQLCEPAGSR
jgi:hypothetical protein